MVFVMFTCFWCLVPTTTTTTTKKTSRSTMGKWSYGGQVTTQRNDVGLVPLARGDYFYLCWLGDFK